MPIWRQRASSRENGLVTWDYHVICLQRRPADADGGAASLAWDLDTTLPFPCAFDRYFREAIRPNAQLHFEFFRCLAWEPAGSSPARRRPRRAAHPAAAAAARARRRYRVVGAAAYLRGFASNRQHMLKEDGSWKAPPPDYPCVVAQDGATMNLHRYWDMEQGGADGDDGGGGAGAAGAVEAGGAAGGDEGRYGRVMGEWELREMFGAQ